MRNLDAQLGDLVQVLDDLVDVLAVLAEIESDLGGLFDRVVVAALGLAVATQHIRSTSSLRPSSGESKMLHASAYRATSRSVFFSPAPPMRMGGCGLLTACGEFSVRSRW